MSIHVTPGVDDRLCWGPPCALQPDQAEHGVSVMLLKPEEVLTQATLCTVFINPSDSL
jgi:hypothetical protein